ncbi:MAG: Type 1 glutamine amidotransferase-like domain-containing protein [Ilumatobacter sp.]|uniref:Type 1 glutamine amidotransferase-like domain-containing protein n=1 Tax=Ilumatobacter sp. TaxID=1967498 RepID=UPI0032978A0D
MPGVICLQGGREFTDQCREMDAEVLSVAGVAARAESGRADRGSVAVLAGAARRGTDYAGASKRARRHYEALGASVVVVPDPRDGIEAAVESLTDDIALLVLPGGSPASLREVLSGRVRQRVVDLHDAGMSISGASAGAMVLCSRMVRPNGGAEVVDGLGLVDGLALPHWTPGSDRGWPVPDDLDLWGLPECGGVIVEGRPGSLTVRAVGKNEPAVRRNGSWRPVPRGAD